MQHTKAQAAKPVIKGGGRSVPLTDAERHEAPATGPMSVLLATNHLFAFTGSEITLYTIAKFLKEKSHGVTVFAKYVNPGFTGVFKGIAPACSDLRQIQGRHYDAAYVQHHTTALEVRHHFPDLPIVLASLGVLPFLEQPPIVDLTIHRGFRKISTASGNRRNPALSRHLQLQDR
ncbi:MAG: hypothetical protein NTV99_11195 [Deltaproteobacteria bacterium]|nr:hypothetical protein [Deltaproteobacteria bacterium]